MHKIHNVAHRDLSPDNILIINGAAKIADFGISRVCAHTYTLTNGIFKGKEKYMSPEILEMKEEFEENYDTFQESDTNSTELGKILNPYFFKQDSWAVG